MEKSLDNAFAKVMAIVGRDTGHIPPITTNEGNPFPYSILVKRKDEGWGRGIRNLDRGCSREVRSAWPRCGYKPL